MFLKGILSISGHSGLFKLISQGKTTIIVENLEDKKRMPAYASSKISSLEDIAIFTDDAEIPLKDVLKSIFRIENGEPVSSGKYADKEIKNYFAQVVPNYDRNRVYISDMKKVFTWYNLLQKHNLIILDEAPVENRELVSEENLENPKV